MKYGKFDEARAHLKDLLDAAAVGRAAVIERSTHTTAFVDRDLLVEQLRRLVAADFQLVADGDRWLATVAGTPVAGEGDSADESVDDLIDALRDYAEDWGGSSPARSEPPRCVADGVAPKRGAGATAAGEPVPPEVVHLLTTKVGLSDDEVRKLTKAAAIARLEKYWTQGS